MKLKHIQSNHLTYYGITTSTKGSHADDCWFEPIFAEFKFEPIITKGDGACMLKFKKI